MKTKYYSQTQYLNICHPVLYVLVRRTIIKFYITKMFKSVSAITICIARMLIFLKLL